MEKAYDLQALLDGLKNDGLELAEDAAKKVVSGVLGWVEESAKLSENPYDDILLPVIAAAKPAIMASLDKIHDKKE